MNLPHASFSLSLCSSSVHLHARPHVTCNVLCCVSMVICIFLFSFLCFCIRRFIGLLSTVTPMC